MARKSRKKLNIVKTIVKNQAVGLQGTGTAELLCSDALATAAYIRLSVENNGHETDNSLKTQITLVESFIREHDDLYLLDTYVDNGFSGTKFDRPEFVRMIEDVKSGRIQCIVVKDLSRFGRDYLETGYYLEKIFPLLNVRFIAITDQFDSIREEDRNGIAVPIKNIVNAMYAKDYSRKQEAFREMCKKAGRVMDINAPYGYRLGESIKRLEIDQSVAPYVRMIFAWALAGVPRLEIARRMEIVGAPTPAKHDNWKILNKWEDSTITHILYNPVYAGFHVMGKSKVSLYRDIRPKRLAREEWVYFPDYHEPYITMDDYAALETMIGTIRKERTERLKVREEDRERMQDIFQGKVFCADCGRQMNYARGSHHRGYKDLSFQYYRCRYSKEYAKCSNKKIQQNFLKIIVMDQIRFLIQAVCDKEKVLKVAQKRFEKPGAMNPIERNISRLTEKEKVLEYKILKAYMDYADKLLDEEEYLMIKKKLADDKETVAAKKEALQRKLTDMKASIEQFQALAGRLEQFLDVQEFDEGLVKEFVNKIFVSDDGRVEIEFSCSDVFQNVLVEEFLASAKEEGDETCNDDCDLFEVV